MIAQGAKLLLQVGAMATLARLLVPQDFGLVAMVTVVIGFAALFKDLGLSMATVQKAQVTHEQVSNLFWINLGFSALMVALTAAVSPLVAWFYGEPRLTGITAALSGLILFGGLAAQHQALLTRQMKFGRIAAADVGGLVVGTAAGIVAAWLGAGYWALVVMQVATSFATAAGFWGLCRWRPGRWSRAAGIRSLLGFGGYLAGFNAMCYLGMCSDKVLLGWYWGARQVGYYSVAFRLLSLPLQRLTWPITAVAVPALSRLQGEPERHRKYYRTAVMTVAYLCMPGIAAMTALSDPLIELLFGRDWLPAAPIFRMLAVAALLRPVIDSGGWMFLSLGRTKRLFLFGLFSVPTLVASYAIGLRWGAKGVALGHTIAYVGIIGLPSLVCAFHRSPVRVRDFLGAIHRPVAISLLVFAGMTGTKVLLGAVGCAVVIAVCCGAGLLVAAIGVWAVPGAWAEVRSLAHMRRMLKAP